MKHIDMYRLSSGFGTSANFKNQIFLLLYQQMQDIKYTYILKTSL